MGFLYDAKSRLVALDNECDVVGEDGHLVESVRRFLQNEKPATVVIRGIKGLLQSLPDDLSDLPAPRVLHLHLYEDAEDAIFDVMKMQSLFHGYQGKGVRLRMGSEKSFLDCEFD